MPRMNETDMQTLSTNNGHFQFSAVRPDRLQASEYTLVNIVIDNTGSVMGFSSELLATLKAIVESCRSSARADNLMIRVTTFNQKLTEVHGFKLLGMIDSGSYSKFKPYGATALYDATEDGVSAVVTYANDLQDQDFDVNGIVFILTDGMDNASVLASPASIATQVRQAMQDEVIESLQTILIGVDDAHCRSELEAFKDEAELSEYISFGDANASNLAKVALFVSQSIGVQSQALGSGGGGASLSF